MITTRNGFCFAGLFTVALLFGLPVAAQTFTPIDTSFLASEGYVDDQLLFQQPDGPGNGLWAGVPLAQVDATAGAVRLNPMGQVAFPRNLWTVGATGGRAGGASLDETGAGFSEGDSIEIELEYQFELANTVGPGGLFRVGVRDCLRDCSQNFDLLPLAGFRAIYLPQGEGRLFVFGNLSPPQSGLEIDSAEIGIDTGFSTGTADLVSDRLLFSYEAALVDEVTNTWAVLDVVVNNLDTQTEVGRASLSSSSLLDPFVYGPGGIGEHVTNPGSEMYLSVAWAFGGNVQSVEAGGVRFAYTAVPEPGAAVLGLMAVAGLLSTVRGRNA